MTIAPAAPHPKPARTNSKRFRAATRTPSERAASSSSRIACSDAPSGERSRKKTAARKTAVKASANQSV